MVTPTAACGESIQEIRKEAYTYTGCLQGWVAPFIKVQLCCSVHMLYGKVAHVMRPAAVILFRHWFRTAMISLMGMSVFLYGRFSK